MGDGRGAEQARASKKKKKKKKNFYSMAAHGVEFGCWVILRLSREDW